MSKMLLDKDLCIKLREVINETDIFFRDSEQGKKFNFICSIMDRFDYAVEFFNSHLKAPTTEDELMYYLVQASIIKDGINYSFKILGMDIIKNNDIFKELYQRDLEGLNGELSDDEYFDYFRSLSFAHPFKTDKSIPNLIPGEIQYSPYCLISRTGFRNEKDSVGVYVYSNKRKPFPITMPFEILQKYIKWKYSLLNNVIDAFENIIIGMENEWKKRKVNRKLDDISILNDIKDILKERYMEYDYIDDLIDYLTCNITEKSNKDNIQIFREAIIDEIPNICDSIDEFDFDKFHSIMNNLLNIRPKAHPMMHYQLEKIFCYLNDDGYGDAEWGLVQADAFAKEFAKKWVVIKPYDMSNKEIKLLAHVACYLEYKEQMMEGKNE